MRHEGEGGGRLRQAYGLWQVAWIRCDDRTEPCPMARTDLVGADLAGGVEGGLRGGGLGKGGGLAGEGRLVAPHTRPRRHHAVARHLRTARGNGARRVSTHTHTHTQEQVRESEL